MRRLGYDPRESRLGYDPRESRLGYDPRESRMGTYDPVMERVDTILRQQALLGQAYYGPTPSGETVEEHMSDSDATRMQEIAALQAQLDQAYKLLVQRLGSAPTPDAVYAVWDDWYYKFGIPLEDKGVFGASGIADWMTKHVDPLIDTKIKQLQAGIQVSQLVPVTAGFDWKWVAIGGAALTGLGILVWLVRRRRG